MRRPDFQTFLQLLQSRLNGKPQAHLVKIIDGKPLMLDVLWVGPSLEPIWASKERMAWQQGEITVVSRDGLITLKLTAGRPQDLVDIQKLNEKESES